MKKSRILLFVAVFVLMLGVTATVYASSAADFYGDHTQVRVTTRTSIHVAPYNAHGGEEPTEVVRHVNPGAVFTVTGNRFPASIVNLGSSLSPFVEVQDGGRNLWIWAGHLEVVAAAPAAPVTPEVEPENGDADDSDPADGEELTEGEEAEEAVVEEAPAPAPAADIAWISRGTATNRIHWVNVRSMWNHVGQEPASIVVTLAAGTQVEIIGQYPAGGALAPLRHWYQVRLADGRTGWVFSPLLTRTNPN